MKYILKTISGQEFEISQEQRDKLSTALLSKQSERAAFVEIGENGPVISTSSIAAITSKRGW